MEQVAIKSLIEVYEHHTRNTILNILESKRNLGESLRNLSRELDVPVPTLLWHLRKLEEHELIVRKKINNELVFISSDYYDDFDNDLKTFQMTFKTESAKKFYNLLLNLEEDQHITLSTIIIKTSWSSRTALRYIKKLQELSILKRNKKGRGYVLHSPMYEKIKKIGEN